MSQMSHLQQTTESGLETAVNAIQQQTSVIFLDLFPRDKLRIGSIYQAIQSELPERENLKKPREELPIRPRGLAETGEDRDALFLKAAEIVMNKGVDENDEHNFFEGCAIAKLHWRCLATRTQKKKKTRSRGLTPQGFDVFNLELFRHSSWYSSESSLAVAASLSFVVERGISPQS